MERNLEQLKQDTKSLKEIEREEIDKLDLSDELKQELLDVVDKLENNIGDMNEEELSELAEYIEQNHRLNEKREELTKKMLDKVGIDTSDVSKVPQLLLEKEYEMIRLIDDSLENRTVYRYSINKINNNEPIIYFYEIEESEGDYTTVKFTEIMEEN